MSDYTPSEELVRDYVAGWAAAGSANPAGDEADVLHLIAKVKADALREAAYEFAEGAWADQWGADGVDDDVSAIQSTFRWFADRADQIEKGRGQ